MAPPPLIGALLPIPFETVRDRMLAGLHQRGYTDLIAAHLNVLQYPGPENERPSELATQTRMTKQALNYRRGQLEQLGYLTRQEDNADASSASTSPPEDTRQSKRSAKSSSKSKPNGNRNPAPGSSRNYTTS